MKIKIFQGNKFHIEGMVNKWFEKNESIVYYDIKQNVIDLGGEDYITMTVIYDEED